LGWVFGEVESELVWEGGLDFCKGVGRPGTQRSLLTHSFTVSTVRPRQVHKSSERCEISHTWATRHLLLPMTSIT